MITKKLQNLFWISLLLVYLHGVEEIVMGFQHNDSFMVAGSRIFQTTAETFYWVSHIIWWLSVPLLFIVFRNTRLGIILLALYGLMFIVEMHHIIKGLIILIYYPGMITAIFYPIFGYFYWKQLLKNVKANKQHAE